MNLNELTGYVRRCVDDYQMIQEGDRICVGISGGKDSLVLLCALRHLQRYYPRPFELEALTVDAGFPGMDFSGVQRLCDELGLHYTILKTDIKEIVFDIRQEENPCSLCSKMRRGALNNFVRDNGFNKLALGHHWDDAVETFMMSLLFEGRLSCFKPVTYMSRSNVTQIRPLLYLGEGSVRNLCEAMELPVVTSTCPLDQTSHRKEIKDLLSTLSARYPDMKSKVFGAMQRLPLDGWGVEK
ncbi:MAG: tRNA 2-thiocytidine biosynthesis TtcA family protein [Oscillospiraceae bacterium]|nr:tRNA 2-thiocytidine biosynthesis TtcA family protein [Oscillospiraceae bacterium]